MSEFDAIVVGSGMTGGWAAKELCERGLKTLVIERGRHVEHRGPEYTDLIPPWERRFHGMPPEQFFVENPLLTGTMGVALDSDNLNRFVKDSEQPCSTPEGKSYHWVRSYHLGGRSLHWTRLAYRMADHHFRAHDKDGYGVGWPIDYADLAPWYDHVEAFIGVAGSVEGLKHFPDGKYQPCFDLNCAEQALKKRVEAAFPDRKVIPGPTANLTAPTREQIALGRTACQSRNYCYRGCHYGAYFSSLSATLPAAKRTGNLTVVTDAVAHSVVYDPKEKRGTGVRVIDAHTKVGRTYSSRMIFLCAGAIPTTQILLLSSSEAFPNGFGNRSGALGRYFTDASPGTLGIGTMSGSDDRYYYGRSPSLFVIPAYRNVTEPSDGYARSFHLLGKAWRTDWRRGASGAGIGTSLKESLRTPGPWRVLIAGEGEMLPRWGNRITLHPTQTDAWGMPLMHIDIAYSDNEWLMAAQAKRDIHEMLQAAGCVDIEVTNHALPGAAIAEAGTAVMGRDPAGSVLNRWNQVHDAENVFVTDASCLPSNANPNSPSLTHMALTARAASHAAELLQEGAL